MSKNYCLEIASNLYLGMFVFETFEVESLTLLKSVRIEHGKPVRTLKCCVKIFVQSRMKVNFCFLKNWIQFFRVSIVGRANDFISRTQCDARLHAQKTHKMGIQDHCKGRKFRICLRFRHRNRQGHGRRRTKSYRSGPQPFFFFDLQADRIDKSAVPWHQICRGSFFYIHCTSSGK